MDRDQLIDLVVDHAMAYLRDDDRNPDVGIGMGLLSAIDLAEKSVLQEAARWNSLAALGLNFDDIRIDVHTILRNRRGWR